MIINMLLYLLLLSSATSEMHYAPVLRPISDDPNDGNFIEIKALKMADTCDMMETAYFCSDKELESLRGISAVICRSIMDVNYVTGDAIGLEKVTSNVKATGYDFECDGSENNIDACVGWPLTCNYKVKVTCLKPGFLGTCNSPCGCMAPALIAKIVGGQEALPGEFPWQVSITDGRYLCGGTILDSRHVLTAAHCIHSPSAQAVPCKAQAGKPKKIKQCPWLTNGFTIYYDTNRYFRRATSNQYKRVKASKVFVHKDYLRDRFTLRHDIAIIRLEKALEMTEYVHPACLPDFWEEFEIPSDAKVTVSGFGDTDQGRGGVFPDVLQKADVAWLDIGNCNPRMYNLLSDEHFCAGDVTGSKDACTGDSGGPLVYKNDEGVATLVGVVSFSYGCALRNHYSVYADVRKELGFIRSVLTENLDKDTVILDCQDAGCKPL